MQANWSLKIENNSSCAFGTIVILKSWFENHLLSLAIPVMNYSVEAISIVYLSGYENRLSGIPHLRFHYWKHEFLLSLFMFIFPQIARVEYVFC